MNQETTFTTYDLNLSAVLLAKGEALEKVEKSQRGKSLFCFRKTKNLDSIISKYWKNELKIEPQALFNSLKAIKNRIYSNYD